MVATRTAVRMALVAATHHSAQQNGAHRGLKTATRAREGEVHEKCDAPRRAAEYRPHRAALFLVVASLADAAADGVDAATLSFLTARALEDRRKEKEEDKEAKTRKKQDAEEVGRLELHSLVSVPRELRTADQERRITAASRILLAASSSKKRRLPKAGSRLFPRSARDLQRRVPAGKED